MTYPDLAVVLYGPGDDRLAHQPNECVDVETFARSIGFFEPASDSRYENAPTLTVVAVK